MVGRVRRDRAPPPASAILVLSHRLVRCDAIYTAFPDARVCRTVGCTNEKSPPSDYMVAQVV